MGGFLKANLLTVTKSAWRDGGYSARNFTVSKSTGRFTDFQLMVDFLILTPDLPADLLTHLICWHQICWQICWIYQICWQKCRGLYFCWQINWLSQNLQFTDCHQICWQICWLSPNLPAEMRGNIDCHQICQQIYWLSPNLLADLLTFTSKLLAEMRGCFCWQIYWLSPNLPADLLNVTKSADRNVGGQCFCWQIYGLSQNLLANLLNVTKSASRFADSHEICQQKCRGCFCHQIYLLSPNLLADLLTLTKSAGRNGGYFCQHSYWLSQNLLADLLNFTLILLADFLTVNTKSAWGFTDSPNLLSDLLTLTPNLPAEMGEYFYQQVYWVSPNLPAEIYCHSKSSGRFTDCHTKSDWQIAYHTKSASAEMGGTSRFTDSPNLLADLLTFTPNLPAICHWICSRNWGVFLLADLLNLTKSADRNVRVSISAGRLTDSHKIDWPIYWLPPNLPAEM